MSRFHHELKRAQAKLAAIEKKLAAINLNPLIVELARVETAFMQETRALDEELKFVGPLYTLRRRVDRDPGVAPGVVVSDLLAFLKDPARAICEGPPKDTRWGPSLAAWRDAIAAGAVILPGYIPDDIVILLNKAIVGKEIVRTVAAKQALEVQRQELVKNPAIAVLLTRRMDLTHQKERLLDEKSQMIARVSAAGRRFPSRAQVKHVFEVIFISVILIAGCAGVPWVIYLNFNNPPPPVDTNSEGGGGGSFPGQCTNETDCIYYRWGDYAIGIMAVDTPYGTPHERVDPVLFQATLKVGGTSSSGGDYVYDYVQAPANRTLWLRSPFEYGGQVRNKYSTLGFQVPWSNTGNIYIQELLYDAGLDQTWGIVWLDGSSWVLLKFPWI